MLPPERAPAELGSREPQDGTRGQVEVLDVRCTACGTDNADQNRFCTDCGTALGVTCATCQAPLQAGQRFCGECGTAVDVPAQASPAGPVSERRMCSVMFVDLVGFTPLSEDRDPEEVRELLSRYFDIARTLIGRYGGVVEKFIGDAVMAVWGTPVATEGDAERAVRAAIDVVAAVGALGADVRAPSLAARAGVVTGEVAVTLGAVGEGMVAGDAVNTAARVQGVATPGSVFVDETTYRLTGPAVAFRAAGDFALKGKSLEVPLWVAERVVSGVGGEQRVDGLEAPLVGRDAELRLVKELFHASADRRTPRVVSVVGPAGVGKSRIGWEFEKYVDGLAETVRWHRGRCLTYGDGVAFWALAQMVRARLGIAEDDTAEVGATKFDEGLARWLSDPSAREFVRPRLGRLLGVDIADDVAFSQQELFAGWRVFFEQLAQSAPVVLLVEDAQHADGGLLDFLQHLLDWARDVPIFILTLGRPELAERRPGWGTGRSGTVLSLEPLDATAMAAMVEGLVPGMPEQGRDAVAAQAQGIPLYAVETIRMLVDQDLVRPVDGVYRLVGDIGELTVPHTLQSLLAARLDSLPPDERRLVADATVLGTTFPAEALVAVADFDAERVHAMLDDLVRREVLAVRADPLSPDQGQYGFVQSMFRQVAYDTQSRRERKARHLSVAQHLAHAFANNGEEVSEVIAGHYLDALSAVPDAPDVEELREQTVAAIVRAAQRAQRTGATGTAARWYAVAAELLDREDDPSLAASAADLYERAGVAEYDGGTAAVAEDLLSRAVTLFDSAARPRDTARARGELGDAIRRRGRLDEARTVLQLALETLQDEPDEQTALTLLRMGMLEAFGGDGAKAEVVIDEGLRIAQKLALPEVVLSRLFIGHGISLVFQMRWAEASASLREAVRLADRAHDAATSARALLNLCDVTVGNDPREAVEAGRLAVAHARQVGLTSMLSAAVSNLVQALILTGEWPEADQLLAEIRADGRTDLPEVDSAALFMAAHHGVADLEALLTPGLVAWSESGDVQDRTSYALMLALIDRGHEDWPAAYDHARQGFEQALEVGLESEGARWSWGVAAECALQLHDEAAVEGLLDLLDRYPSGQVPRMIRVSRSLARARLAAGRGDERAELLFDEAIAELRSWRSPYHLAEGLLAYGQFLFENGDEARARLLVSEAWTIADSLGAHGLRGRAMVLAST